MLKSIRIALGAIALIVVAGSAAEATPITLDYNLTGTGGVTGHLTLDLSVVPTGTANVTQFQSDILAGSQITFGSDVFALTSANVKTLEFSTFASTYQIFTLTDLTAFHSSTSTDTLQTSSSFNYAGPGVPNGGSAGFFTGNATVTVPATSVPEPLTASLFGAGVACAAMMRRRKKTIKA